VARVPQLEQIADLEQSITGTFAPKARVPSPPVPPKARHHKQGFCAKHVCLDGTSLDIARLPGNPSHSRLLNLFTPEPLRFERPSLLSRQML
jgi:hypothetical protein